MNGPVRTAASPAAPGKYLSFRLGAERYGIGILRVREIIGMVDVTPLPRTPGFVRGVINLRGRIVPVIDLRERFCMARVPDTAATCIVVVDSGGDDGALRVGCVVDGVDEVVAVGADQVEPMPRCANAPGDHVAGLAKRKEHVLILLDIERVLADLDADVLGGGA